METIGVGAPPEVTRKRSILQTPRQRLRDILQDGEHAVARERTLPNGLHVSLKVQPFTHIQGEEEITRNLALLEITKQLHIGSSKIIVYIDPDNRNKIIGEHAFVDETGVPRSDASLYSLNITADGRKIDFQPEEGDLIPGSIVKPGVVTRRVITAMKALSSY